MIDLSKEKEKKFGIFGLSRTGIAAYRALQQKCRKLICYDDSKENREKFAKEFGTDSIKPLDDESWLDLDEIIISPGIPTSLPKPHKVAEFAKENNIQIISDMDLLYRNRKDADYIAITGTNGKSTTTALIHHIFKEAGLNYDIGGNIGKPALDMDNEAKGYVLELSSYQIELTKEFYPNLGIITNITPDHLDRHGNMENYKNIKTSLLADSKRCIISTDDLIMRDIFTIFQNKSIPASVGRKLDNGISIIDSKIIDNIDDTQYDLPVNKSLQGIHNQQNIAIAFAAGRIRNILPETILKALGSFKALPHRMEYLGTKNQVEFYNDSKATNAIAAGHALSSLKNIYWIAGGVAKEGGIESLMQYSENIAKAYFFGEAASQFSKTWNGVTSLQKCNKLDDAFAAAHMDAKASGKPAAILLSPASASFDQFKDFEERGYHFVNLYGKI